MATLSKIVDADLPGLSAKKMNSKFYKRWQSYKNHHQECALNSVREFLNKPFDTLRLVLVLSLTMALPIGLLMVGININSVGGALDSTHQITVFGQNSLSHQKVEDLSAQLSDLPAVKSVNLYLPHTSI